MSRSRLEPLGVPDSCAQEGRDDPSASRSGQPSALDRWLVGQLKKRLADGSVNIELWGRPQSGQAKGDTGLRINDRSALLQLLINPELHFGDLYSAGRIEVYGDLLTLLDHAYEYVEKNRSSSAWHAWRVPAPDLSQSRRNIHHHYDIGNAFYKLWLDREALQYTCAYYPAEAITIEEAQLAKLHHVCRKLWLKPGESVVEAGSGWGGFAIFMAKHYGANVRTFNISHEQIVYAREWAEREGVGKRIEFVEDDYRNTNGQYDVFVSIGMLEHVGVGNYTELGQLISRSLRPEGRGLIHSIGRDRPARLNAWIDKRIFPGAYPATLRQMMHLFEPSDLSVLDVENLRLHYAKTLEAWLERYEEHVDEVRSMFDEAFVRAWRLYLLGSIAAFRRGSLQLFQILFARSRVNRIPWTRAHIYARGDSTGQR